MAKLRLSAFDVIGPAMVGPSSSHTAGAARIGLLARALLGVPPQRALIELHGSFASTGRGHATDRALVAGLLGLQPDDPRLPDSLEQAKRDQLDFTLSSVDLGDGVHPNTVRLSLSGGQPERSVCVVASSLGGGVVEVTEIDGYSTDFRGDADTLVFWHEDHPGFLARITGVLACVEINIARLRTSRQQRGRHALTVLELDAPAPSEVLAIFSRIKDIRSLSHLAPLP